MTSNTLQRQLAALPARQLNLLAIGTVAVAAALALSAVRAPLAQLRAQRERLNVLAGAPSTLAPAVTGPAPQAAGTKAMPPPTPLALIAAVSAGAQTAGVTVASAVPGPERGVAGLRQQTLEIDASGSYAAILEWIAGIEARQPAVGVIRVELTPAHEAVEDGAQDGAKDGAQERAQDGARRLVKLRLGVYSAGSRP